MSGVTLPEQSMVANTPGYKEHVEATSAFISCSLGEAA